MNSPIISLMLVFTVPLVLISCSGGKGSSNNLDANNEQTESVTSSVTNTSADLTVPNYADLRSTYELSLDIDIGENKRSYLSLCNGEGVEGALDVNYEDCLLRSSLQQGQLQQTIKVANHLNNLVATIWFYDGTEPKLFRYNASSEEEQSFEVQL